MLINTVFSLAFYCSRCGKIKMHDISRFGLKNSVGRELFCDCGQQLAKLIGSGHDQCLLEVFCVICETKHAVWVNIKDFWRGKVDKIYCAATNLELGFSGNRKAIEDTIANQEREFDIIAREVTSDDYVEKPQIMIEVLNKIDDIAEKGGVYCRCGGNFVEANVKQDHVELICMQCDARRVISAKTEADVVTIKSLGNIEFGPGHRFRHRR
ncbi:MAG: hypothetical protein H6Q73_784 [Firmicutes bacterium]|nr:hypothetical protein [Bacillota bacterium]